MRTIVLALLVGAATLAVAQPLSAQSSGFALDRFDIAEVGSDWFVGESLDLRGHMRFSIGLTGDWARNPLVEYYEDNDAAAADVVAHQVYTHLGANLILANRLRLGLNLPILVFQAGDGTRDGTVDAERGVAAGDLRLGADLRLLGEYGSALSVAAGLQLYLPSGNREAFAGDGDIRVVPRVMIAGDIGTLAYSARLGVMFRPQNEDFGNVDMGHEVQFAGTFGIRFLDKRLLVGPEIWGSTVVSEGNAALRTSETPFELLLGAHYRHRALLLGAGFGPGLNRGVGAPEFRLVGSIAYQREYNHDRDDDGIVDEEDACPDDPGVRTDDPRTNGCPPDRDGDGIYDRDDACPDVPGVPTDDPETNGCPPDRDGDGIYDDEDACPDEPGVPSDDPLRHGCPDRDGDGIFDQDDACPDIPGVPDEDPLKNGCPPDRDGDGIYDEDDACPDIPGLPNDDPRIHGCPIAHIVKNQIKIYQRIEFEFDKATLLPSSEVVLTAVLEILQQHPELSEIMVEGHTDAVGTAEYNRRLSQARATTVVKWLWARGIERLRLRPVGRGFDEPIDTNETAVGRQKNRRVEFHILSINGEPPPDLEESAGE